MRVAVYAGSFDPVTNGHLWVIEHAIDLFDKVIVAVGINHRKRSTFSLEDRVMLLSELTKNLPMVEVVYFDNSFLVDFTKKVSAKYIIRGIRTQADYEYERIMHNINTDIDADIRTIFFMPPRKYSEVSSEVVKSLVGYNDWESLLERYVPDTVLEYLRHSSLNKQKT